MRFLDWDLHVEKIDSIIGLGLTALCLPKETVHAATLDVLDCCLAHL